MKELIYCYKTMPDFHKNNMKNYLILDGIYTVYPNISDEDVEFLFNTCLRVENEKLNPYAIAHYLTDEYVKKNITKNQLLTAQKHSLTEAVFFDDLNYLLKDTNEFERNFN